MPVVCKIDVHIATQYFTRFFHHFSVPTLQLVWARILIIFYCN
jgi:hypothetical protein